MKQYTEEEMFSGKTVFDVGCGAGGKTMYYASKGAAHIVGMDMVEHYKEESEKLAEELGFADKFEFICRDASETGFPDNSFDTIIMNDAMENVAEPEKVVAECARILRPGGRLF